MNDRINEFKKKFEQSMNLNGNTFIESAYGDDMFHKKVAAGEEAAFTRAAPGGVGVARILAIYLVNTKRKSFRTNPCYSVQVEDRYYEYRYLCLTENGRILKKNEYEIIKI